MADPFGGLPVDLLSRIALVLALGFAAVVLARSGVLADARAGLSARFVYSVPWGTLVVVAWLLLVFLVVQGAWDHPWDPLVVPFRSWSYFYPEGMFFAPFAHNGQGHLIGNLVSTLAFLPIVEYAWGHYPRRQAPRGHRWLGRPAGRIGALVLAVFVMGLLPSLFVPGPLIGFSGVVFAFAGVAIVVAPLWSIAAILASNVISLTYRSWMDPVSIAEAQQRFIFPWWADTAIHGHALGLLLGIAAGIWLLRRTDGDSDLTHVWLAGAIFGVAEAMWAFFWPVGPSRFALFRGVGFAAIVFFATLIVVAVGGSDRSLLGRLRGRDDAVSGRRLDLSSRRAALVVLLVPVVVLALVAVPFNAITIDESNVDDGVRVGDYRITYAENVDDLAVAAVPLPFLQDQLSVQRSGVIVVNTRRHVWESVIHEGGLAFRGTGRVTVGGIGWRETVFVNRTTWTVVDGGATYTVYVSRPGQPRKQVYIDEPVLVPAVLDGKRVAIRPTRDGYRLHVSRNETVVDQAPMPGPGENVTLANITFSRTGKTLAASFDRTSIDIARLKLRDRDD